MSASIEVVGTKEAIRALNKIEDGARKQFVNDAKRILQPAVTEVQNAYPADALSGMSRNWTQKGKQKFPYVQGRARRGVTVKVDSGRRTKSPIKILQRDPAATIIEFAGRGSGNRLAQSLDSKFGRPSRFAWPAVLRRLPDVQDEMAQSVLKVVNRVNKELR
jgi:hypothetical protein